MSCKEDELIVPEKFKQDYVSKTCKFGRFLTSLQDKKKKNKEEILIHDNDFLNAMNDYRDQKNTSLIQILKNMSKKDFLQKVLLNDNVDFEDLLALFDTVEGKGIQGNLYEAAWDILIKKNVVSLFSNYDHVFGKIENANLYKGGKIEDITKYLSRAKVLSGNISGVVDIALVENSCHDYNKWICESDFVEKDYDNTRCNYLFLSSKFYKEEQSIVRYDIQKIYNNMKLNYKDTTFKIVLLVRDKKELTRKITSKSFYYEYVLEVLELSDMLYYISLIRDTTQFKEIENHVIKPKLSLRFHQLLCVNKAVDSLMDRDNRKTLRQRKQILFGQIARSGKTYMVGGIISKLYKKNMMTRPNAVFLIITPVPSETKEQFLDDLFYKFVDFDDFEILDLKQVKSKEYFKTQKPKILVCSKQFLEDHTASEKSHNSHN